MSTIDPEVLPRYSDPRITEWLKPISPDKPLRQSPVAKAYCDRARCVTRAINEALGHDFPEDDNGLLMAAEALLDAYQHQDRERIATALLDSDAHRHYLSQHLRSQLAAKR